MNNIKIVDYNEEHITEMDALEDMYWGLEIDESIADEINENTIVKVAIDNNKVIGFIHLTIIGNLLYIKNILVAPNYQKKKIGFSLLTETINIAKKINVKTILAHAVETNGHINVKPLLEKFRFESLYHIEKYWDAIYPNCYCKQCQSQKCRCGATVFIKTMDL